MSTPRKPTAGFWIVVGLVVLPVLYVASFGPLQWLIPYIGFDSDVEHFCRIYAAPLDMAHQHGPQWFRNAMDSYLGLFWGE